MALPSPPPTRPRRSPRRWQFTWEALAHIPTLRLFLFNPEVDPSARCGSLQACLCLEESQLVVSWTEEGAGDLALRVPVPRVLVDPGSPLQCVARADHVELKLVLVLPPDHPMSVNLRAALDGGGVAAGQGDVLSGSSLPLSLDSDIKSLSSGDVHFYCRTCCTRLTRRSPRNFVEMPSANWREVADNWFGACCCSFGGASEKMVHEYVKAYSCSEATCLLDGPSVTICKDDLDGSVFPECSGEQVDCSNMFDVVATAREGNPNSRESVGYLPQNDWGLNEINGTVVAERKLDTNKSSDALIGSPVHRVFSKESVLCCVDQTSNLLNHAHGRTPDVSDRFSRMLPSMTSHTSQNWLCNGSLGNGFLIKTSNLSNDVQWVEFLCRQCSSLLGSYPVHGINGPIDGGIRLFKCYISTSMDVGGPHNVFRQHTMQRVFVNLLLESATDELSFCTIVRDLRTKFPMVQIILLNSKAWCAKGDCLENDTSRCLFEVNLQPVVKVLFSDCNIETGVNSRAMEQWTTKRNADEVYMMAHQTKELMEFLKLAHESLPPSYSSFQGMSLSYIER